MIVLSYSCGLDQRLDSVIELLSMRPIGMSHVAESD